MPQNSTDAAREAVLAAKYQAHIVNPSQPALTPAERSEFGDLVSETL